MLSRRDIEKEMGKGINIFPIIQDNFKENSINLTASRNAWATKGSTVYWYGGTEFGLKDTSEKKKTKVIKSGENCVISVSEREKYVVLLPNSTTLIETSEVLGIGNNIGGALHSKVGVVAKGIGHIGTMLGPGYCGHLLISLHNITDDVVALKVGSTFISLSFDYLTTQVVRTSSTTSGHVDKFSELGIKIDEDTRNYLTADWKSNVAGVKEKMVESEAYKNYRKHIRKNSWKEIKKYINRKNIIAVIVVSLLFAGLLALAHLADSRLTQPVWVERFWNIGCSGVVGSLLIFVYRFLKDKK